MVETSLTSDLKHLIFTGFNINFLLLGRQHYIRVKLFEEDVSIHPGLLLRVNQKDADVLTHYSKEKQLRMCITDN